MPNFFFAVHPSREDAKIIYEDLREYIVKLGGHMVLTPEQADFTVAIGGDGTMVSAWRKSAAPLIGINAGTLGYLTRVEPEHARDAILSVFEGRYSLENRMTLACKIEGGASVNALNEAALLRMDTRVIRFNVTVDGVELMSYTADGMIAATPTGSTGYSLSAGGPIVDPAGEMLILTPIAPHTLVNRPIVLSPSSIVTLISENDALFSADGLTRTLPKGKALIIKRSPNPMRFVSFGKESFISRLRKKLA